MRLLVTGGAGFIGKHFVDLALGSGDQVVVLDKLTYAADPGWLPEEAQLIVGDIADPLIVREAMQGAAAVINFAAESHVDRSIADQTEFLRTNILGAGVLLDAARELGVERFVQISTDEVYGPLASGSADEESPLHPSSPYSASKAAADLLVGSQVVTHGIDAVICRGSNNFGPGQFPEKLIPRLISRALLQQSLPLYGDGLQVRNWLFVEDFCAGVCAALYHGQSGEVYNLGGAVEMTNLDLVSRLIETFRAAPGLPDIDADLINFIPDRPGHDRRYSLNSSKAREQLDWAAAGNFEARLRETVCWTRDHPPPISA